MLEKNFCLEVLESGTGTFQSRNFAFQLLRQLQRAGTCGAEKWGYLFWQFLSSHGNQAPKLHFHLFGLTTYIGVHREQSFPPLGQQLSISLPLVRLKGVSGRATSILVYSPPLPKPAGQQLGICFYCRAQFMKFPLRRRKQDSSQQCPYSFRICSEVKASANPYRGDTMKEMQQNKVFCRRVRGCSGGAGKIQLTLENHWLYPASVWF